MAQEVTGIIDDQINEKLNILIKDLKAAEIGEETELPCRIYEATGKWDVIQ